MKATDIKVGTKAGGCRGEFEITQEIKATDGTVLGWVGKRPYGDDEYIIARINTYRGTNSTLKERK